MVQTVENGKYEQREIIPSDKPKRGRRPNGGSGGAVSKGKWTKNLTPEMVGSPCMMGLQEGFPEGIMSNDYVSEKLARLLIDQVQCANEEASIKLVHAMWRWRLADTSRQKKLELERLRAKVERDLAAINALEEELTLQ